MKSGNMLLYVGLAITHLGLIWLIFQLYNNNRTKKKLEQLEAERNAMYDADIKALINMVFRLDIMEGGSNVNGKM